MTHVTGQYGPGRLSPKSIATSFLEGAKFMAVEDTRSALESATPQVRRAFARMADDQLRVHEDWFEVMERKGWYKVVPANNETLNMVRAEARTIGAYGGTGSMGVIGRTGNFPSNWPNEGNR
ncbi:MAG TPA: spore coat protein [Bacillota bacterium]|jgi:spore coat protein CotF